MDRSRKKDSHTFTALQMCEEHAIDINHAFTLENRLLLLPILTPRSLERRESEVTKTIV